MSFVPIKPNQLAFGSLNANQRSTKSVDLLNKPCNESAPDPLGGGTYSLQSVSTTLEKGSGSRD